jgi:hypothetical protein
MTTKLEVELTCDKCGEKDSFLTVDNFVDCTCGGFMKVGA